MQAYQPATASTTTRDQKTSSPVPLALSSTSDSKTGLNLDAKYDPENRANTGYYFASVSSTTQTIDTKHDREYTEHLPSSAIAIDNTVWMSSTPTEIKRWRQIMFMTEYQLMTVLLGPVRLHTDEKALRWNELNPLVGVMEISHKVAKMAIIKQTLAANRIQYHIARRALHKTLRRNPWLIQRRKTTEILQQQQMQVTTSLARQDFTTVAQLGQAMTEAAAQQPQIQMQLQQQLSKKGERLQHLKATLHQQSQLLEQEQGDLLDELETREDGASRLIWAAKSGRLSVVQWLLHHGSAFVIEQTDNTYGPTNIFGYSKSMRPYYINNALVSAATSGHLHVVKWLLQYGGASIKKANNELQSGILIGAVQGGHLPTVQWLLRYGGVSIKERERIYGDTALMLAARNGHLHVVKWLLQYGGASIKEVNSYGKSALLLAAEYGSLPLVQWLLQHGGASIKEVDSYGRSALLLAAEHGYLPVVQWLLQHGGASIKEVNSYGKSALLLAAKHGHLPMVQWLLQHGGASIKEICDDEYANTALLLAVQGGHLPVVQWLLQHGGASIKEVDKFGNTALLKAAIYGHLSMLQWLLQHGGASIKETDKRGHTALLWAARLGCLPVVQWLLQYGGASIKEANELGNTALLLAASYDSYHPIISTIQWLLQYGGASIKEANKRGEIALNLAENAGIRDFLRAYAQADQKSSELKADGKNEKTIAKAATNSVVTAPTTVAASYNVSFSTQPLLKKDEKSLPAASLAIPLELQQVLAEAKQLAQDLTARSRWRLPVDEKLLTVLRQLRDVEIAIADIEQTQAANRIQWTIRRYGLNGPLQQYKKGVQQYRQLKHIAMKMIQEQQQKLDNVTAEIKETLKNPKRFSEIASLSTKAGEIKQTLEQSKTALDAQREHLKHLSHERLSKQFRRLYHLQNTIHKQTGILEDYQQQRRQFYDQVNSFFQAPVIMSITVQQDAKQVTSTSPTQTTAPVLHKKS
jgi:ankyrin repeat protein